MSTSVCDCAFGWRTFRVICSVLFVFAASNFIEAFNVDLPSAVVYHGFSQSMFGFTVAEYKEDGKSWVLIGAPEAPDPQFALEEADYRGGSVYACDVFENDRCKTLRFPIPSRGGNLKNDYRGRQWLGATLVTAGSDGAVLACAPRYYWFTPNRNDSMFREPVGSCYYSEKGFSNFTEYSPCRINTRSSFGYGKLGSCQAGFSATISKDSNRFYLGAVGSYYWQGQLFSMHKVLKLPYAYDDHEILFDETGKLIARNFRGRPEFMATEEGKQHTDDSYLGYSVTSLEIYGTEITGAAVGVPRDDQLLGKVKIYTWNIINFKNLTGEQFASYFGYSICTSDVDGDGSQDLIIGAPMYSNFQSNDYETGRVYVYYQGNDVCSSLNSTCGQNKFSRWSFIDGEHTKGRFGLAVASLGDINQDGYGDFAVSAPYEGSTECRDQRVRTTHTGAVYIFHGSRYGIRKKYSQVIRASDVYHQNQAATFLNTFGFSLAGGLDLDNNLYPDLVVGAYESDVVFQFKSRPVIQLVANFSFAMDKKAIGLDEYRCNLRGNIWVPCAMLQMCLVYEGIGVEQQIELLLRITLDSRNPKTSRMFFLEKDDLTIGGREPERIFETRLRLYKDTPLCRNMTTYVARLAPNQDKLTPLEAELKYDLVQPINRRPGVLPSILNMDDETPLTRKDALSIKNNCGDDNVCIPDLHMSLNSNVDQYILGSGHLFFNVSVSNDGEDSFGSTFKLRIPPGINYSRFELAKSGSDVLIYCSAPTMVNNNTITCDVGNPLPRGKTVNFSVILEPNNEVEESRFEFWANVNSTNSELSKTMVDNEKLFYIQIVEKTSLSIESSCTPKEVYYNVSQYDFENIANDIQAGPFLKHEYVIKNSGPSEVSEATAVFYWPLKIASGEDLLYLIGEPETRGPIECEKIVNPNYRHLELIRKYRNDDTSEGSNESWQSSGSTHTYYTQGTKYTQTGSVNDIQRPPNTGNKGDYPKPDDTFQVGVIGLNPPNYGGNSYQQSGQNTYYQQTGQTGSVYQGGQVYQGGYSDSGQSSQGGYSVQGSTSGTVQSNQGGYSGTVQGGQGGYTNINKGSYSGTAQSNQGGFYSGTVQSGQGGYSGTVQSGQGSYSGTVQSGQGSYSGTVQNGQGSYSGTVQSGQSGHTYSSGLPGGYYGTFQGNYGNTSGFQTQGSIAGIRQNLNNFHESETTYTKTTDWDGNNPNTYSETKWRTNDNGVQRNGSYSNVQKGSGYDSNVALDTNKKSFFGKEGQSTFFSQGSSSSSGGNIDINAINGATIQKGYDPATGTYITTIEEKFTGLDPEVRRRLNETGSIYRFKNENTQIVQPNRITYGPVTFTKDTTSSRMSTRSHKSPDEILRSDDGNSGDEDDEDNDADDKGDDAEDKDDEDSSEPKHRRKRQVYGGFTENSFCSLAQCIRVQCVIRRLRADQEATVTFPSVVWVKTIQKIALFRPVQVGSYVEVNITKLPHIRAQVSNVTYVSEVLTNVTSLDFGKTPPDVIPLWVVVGSACLGALILMLLIYLLYKSGFFKRNRPPMMPERQPLNRNGQYHLGDEAL